MGDVAIGIAAVAALAVGIILLRHGLWTIWGVYDYEPPTPGIAVDTRTDKIIPQGQTGTGKGE